LVDNNCHIWDGDCYANYLVKTKNQIEDPNDLNWDLSSPKDPKITQLTQEQFINKIKTNDEFAKKFGDLGPIYGKQWRSWAKFNEKVYTKQVREVPEGGRFAETRNVNWVGGSEVVYIDQIANLINDLKTNPDSRRLLVSAWNPAELDQMVLPPCHYGFQVYTRELSNEEIAFEANKRGFNLKGMTISGKLLIDPKEVKEKNLPTRAISLMWNQRSVDTFLGLPFNIASYGLLLEIIAKVVNMVPDELIGNLGDVHLYSNHVEQAKEQIGREMTWEEQVQWVIKNTDVEMENLYIVEEIAKDSTPKYTREPFPLPTLNINTEFWPYEGGECGEGPLDAIAVFNGFRDSNFCKCLLEADIQLANYQSHPAIKAPLSN
jgi:thymidylate synthase